METFASFRVGSERLVGMLHLPDTLASSTGFGLVVMLHGLGGDRSERGRLLTQASRFFAAGGLASLRFDFRGSGDSQGEHAAMTVTDEVEDVTAAVDHARNFPEIDAERVSLLGFSLGALVAALAAPQVAPHRLALWSPLLPSDLLRLVPGGQLPAGISEYQGMGVGRAFLLELPRLDPLTALGRAQRVTHVFQGEKDEVAPESSGQQYAHAANAPYSVVPRVGHYFERLGAREALYEGTLHFLRGR
ncbi:alpha/beta hydrolase family protein [Deinococcus peraridilitoris]|uniref:X-Pro dipeptidyl-peptidase (S15 family) n=1 Tax=Deinococcus peraridilitoris (strain DSM 19664 / LMG 22246 / CIP 109416 / KR-200) TaxID=937777 RepID=L0A6B4_DEIPD|nr:alpha/beta hydrolase [Deinococcus peraridilitoris]AFZ68989.1 X-Pro dipeptidyl-peptidase (S15 family) [Deinococcus peraridilitoris DSM 19664]